MLKKVVLCMLAGAVLMGSCLAAPEVPAPSCLLMDRATGTVLYEKNADEPLAPASVTKVMTLLLVMEAIERGQLDWDDTVTASAAAAAKGGSQVYLEEGEQMSLREMVKCVVVSSANDCATALAEAVAGSESGFVEKMNQRAKELGMEHTHFANCTGLDDEAGPEEHYTTARDIAIMSRALLQHDEIREFTTIWMDTIRDGAFGLSNTNKLVRFYQGTTGLKTGYTASAGYCMSASAERDGMELIATVMHCESSTDRFESAKALLDYGFAAYRAAPVPLPQERPLQLKVKGSTEETVPLDYAALPQTALLPAESAGQLTVQLELPEVLEAPVTRGQTVGKAQLLCGEAVQGEYPVCAAADAPRMDFDTALQLLWDSLRGVAA